MFDRPVELRKLGQTQTLDERNINADIKQTEQVYNHANRDSGVRWVEGLQSSVPRLRAPGRVPGDRRPRADRACFRQSTRRGLAAADQADDQGPIRVAVEAGDQGGTRATTVFDCEVEWVRGFLQQLTSEWAAGRLSVAVDR